MSSGRPMLSLIFGTLFVTACGGGSSSGGGGKLAGTRLPYVGDLEVAAGSAGGRIPGTGFRSPEVVMSHDGEGLFVPRQEIVVSGGSQGGGQPGRGASQPHDRAGEPGRQDIPGAAIL